MFAFSISDLKCPFWINLVQLGKIFSLSWNLVLRLIQICRIQWWCSPFLFLKGDTCFGQIWSQNLKLLVQSKDLILRLIQIWRIHWWCLFFLFSFGSILVWENCFERSKLFVEAEILKLDYFKYIKFDGDLHLICFRPFFASFVKRIQLKLWCCLINLLAVYSQRREASGFSYVN